METPIDVVVLKCRKIYPTGNRLNRALFASPKTISAPSQTVANARISPKVCHGQPPTFGSQRSKFHPNRFTFGGVTAERVNAVLLAHRVFGLHEQHHYISLRKARNSKISKFYK